MRQSYKITRLDIQHQDTHTASWKGFGRQAIKGTQHIYSVKDGNYRSLNKWTIAVRVPNAARGKIIVQPITPPGKKIWADIERRSIVLVRATKHPYRNRVYCKLNLADPTGWQNKVGARRGERGALPKWFQRIGYRMRLKQTVSKTRGTDANAQVVLVRPADHKTMISLYFALKVWVLAEAFVLK
jgi:hypothetical protein